MVESVTYILEQAKKALKEIEGRDDLTEEEQNAVKGFYEGLGGDHDSWFVTKKEAYNNYLEDRKYDLDYDKEHGTNTTEELIPFEEFEMYDGDGYKLWGWMSSSTNC